MDQEGGVEGTPYTLSQKWDGEKHLIRRRGKAVVSWKLKFSYVAVNTSTLAAQGLSFEVQLCNRNYV